MIVSWERCHCAPARAAHPERAAWGHLEVACQEPGCDSVWYSPRHEPLATGGRDLVHVFGGCAAEATACGLLPTSLSGDLAAALREHGSATLDEHYGHSQQPWLMPWSAVSALCRAQLR